jgi:hypothetical protein
VNKTGLSARTNRSIGKKAPSVYLSVLQKSTGMSAPEMDDTLRTHAIDPKYLRDEDFDGFLEARRVTLLERIAAAMGKPVAVAEYGEPISDAYDQDDELDVGISGPVRFGHDLCAGACEATWPRTLLNGLQH